MIGRYLLLDLESMKEKEISIPEQPFIVIILNKVWKTGFFFQKKIVLHNVKRKRKSIPLFFCQMKSHSAKVTFGTKSIKSLCEGESDKWIRETGQMCFAQIRNSDNFSTSCTVNINLCCTLACGFYFPWQFIFLSMVTAFYCLKVKVDGPLC